MKAKETKLVKITKEEMIDIMSNKQVSGLRGFGSGSGSGSGEGELPPATGDDNKDVSDGKYIFPCSCHIEVYYKIGLNNQPVLEDTKVTFTVSGKSVICNEKDEQGNPIEVTYSTYGRSDQEHDSITNQGYNYLSKNIEGSEVKKIAGVTIVSKCVNVALSVNFNVNISQSSVSISNVNLSGQVGAVSA